MSARHKIPMWHWHRVTTSQPRDTPGDAALGGRSSHTSQTWDKEREIICQESWAKYANWKALGLGAQRKCVVGYLWCCREAIYANVMISRNIYGERIEILPRRCIVSPVSSLERGILLDTGYNIQLARPSNEQCWYSKNQPAGGNLHERR